MTKNIKIQFKSRFPMASLVVLLLSGLVSLSSQAKTANNDIKTQLAAYGEALAIHNRVLGTWALYQGEDTVFKQSLVPNEKGSGIVIDQSAKVLQYKIGSISKTFTSVITFKLIEAEKLSLDTSLAQFYPEITNAADITIGQMLNHHSGIGSYTDSEDFLSYYQKPQSQAQMVSRIEALPAAFKPGEKAAYSNSNFLLLGYILEQVSGQSYADLFKVHITEPLKLKHTFYGSDDQVKDIQSYQWINDSTEWQVIPNWSLSVAGAAGAVISTADDLHLFFRGLFKDQLISAKSREQMLKLTDDFGYGIFETDFMDGEKKIIGFWHNGGIEGFASHASYFPSVDMTAVVLSNGIYKSSIGDLNQAIKDAYLGLSLQSKIEAFDIKAEQLKPYTGYFKSETSPLDIEVSLLDNQLMAQATGQGAFPLTLDGDHRFTFKSAGIEMLFSEDFNGFTLNQGDNHTPYQRNDADAPKTVEVDQAILQSYVGVYASDSFPLDITVTLKDGQLHAQATGQGAFPLAAQSATEFTFAAAGIDMVFDAENNSMRFSQMGNNFEMQRKAE